MTDTKKIDIKEQKHRVLELKPSTEDQKQLALELEKLVSNTKFIEKNWDKFDNENTRLFYQLPLNDIQRKKLYSSFNIDETKN